MISGLAAILSGAIFCTVVAWAKEYYDSRNFLIHTADEMDAVSTMGGGLAGCILFTIALIMGVLL
jgi:hypothetical protein